MKFKILWYAILFGCTLLVQDLQAQFVTQVKYQIKYNTTSCRWDCFLIIDQGSATLASRRAQGNAQYSVVVPTGSTVNIAQNFMPLQNNGSYTGTIPLIWQISNIITSPAAEPQSDFYGITPTLSPTSHYNNLAAGDTIRLFALNINPTTNCGAGIRIYQNGIDPGSSDPGMEGGDFSNGFTVGSPNQAYAGNAPKVNPPPPVLNAVSGCSLGVEVDLTATTSACQSPLSYSWTGPNGYTGTTQDVSINPSTPSNDGLYQVTVTDARGCSATTSATAVSKPSAGPDASGCAGSVVSLTGTGPDTGIWTALPSNPAGASLGGTTNGSANVDFSDTASGDYDFIYTTGSCSDTVNLNIILPNAGDDPAPVGCFSSGTATMAAAGTGIWSVSNASAGTAVIANPSDPSSTVSGFSAPGTYFLVWTVGNCTDIAEIVVNDNCSCTITNNTLSPVSPPNFCGTSGVVNIDGGDASPDGGNYTWQYSINNGAFNDALGNNSLEDYATVSLSEGSHRFRRIYTVPGDPVCRDTSNVVLFTVNNNPLAPSNLTATPNPVCLGTTVMLSVTNNPGASYIWSASSPNAGLVASTGNSTVMVPIASGSFTISVTQTVNGCTSTPATVGVAVNNTPPTPTAGTVSSQNPLACGASSGSISFSGLTPNTAYTLNYFKNSFQLFANLISDGSGVLTLANQSAGTYTDFSYTNAAGCASGVYAGPVTLTDPSAPPPPADLMADPNPTCANTIVGLSVTNNPGATYAWSASSPDAGLVSSTTNTTTLLPLLSGFYTINVTQTVAGCTSVPASIGISINNTPPTPTALTVSRTNPTTCGGTNGTISLSGLMPFTAYDFHYTKGVTPFTVNITTNGSGVAIITNQSAGTFTDFSITNITGCSSAVYPGPVTLTDPNSPSAPANLTANPSPVCLGNSVSLSVTNTVGATYSWTASSPNAGLVAVATNSTTALPTAIGMYTISVTQTVAGCLSPVSTVSFTVNPTPPTPTAGTVTAQNPSSCGGSDGSISFSGLLASTVYTLNYSKNNQPLSTNIVTDISGVAILTGQTSGSYTNFSFTNATGCASGIYGGPVNLSDPNAPLAPANLQAIPNPVCVGTTVNLSVTNNPGATYTWSASSPNAGLVLINSNTTTMVATAGGSYTINVTQTVAGCTSPAASVIVDINSAPPTPSAGTLSSVNPSVCGGSDGSINLSGLIPNAPYTIQYTFNVTPFSVNVNSDGSGVAMISGLSSGNYTGFNITNAQNCTSGTYNGTVGLSDPGSPLAPEGLTAVPNPVCLGNVVNLSVTNNPGATYTWSTTLPAAGLVLSTTNVTTMLATATGTYTINVIQTVAGCTSPAASVEVVVNAVPPTMTQSNVAGVNPTTCNGSDGLIVLSGLPSNLTYTLNYSKNNVPTNTNVTTDISGSATVFGLTAGSYTNFSLVGTGNCLSGIYAGPVTLADPAAPGPPQGLNAVPNPVCFGNAINLSVTNNPSATYNWSASSAQAGLVPSVVNFTTMTALSAGNYTISVTQTVAGCISAAATLDVNINPLPPTPTQATVTSTNPTTCGGNDGSISFSGLPANSTFTVNYNRNNVPAQASITTNAGGVGTIINLNQGSYSDFVLTNSNGCSSGTYNGPVQLSDPSNQPAPSNLTAVPNPVCLGAVINLSVTNNPGATYTWLASSPNAGLVSVNSNQTTMLAIATGNFVISVTQTVSGCVSPAATVNVVVNPVPATPTQNQFSTVDPTCGTNNGSILISGFAPNAPYVVNYSRNNIAQSVNISSNQSGTIILSQLLGGSYTNFSFTNATGCTSGIFAGPVNLVDPGLPAIPSNFISSPDQICIRSAVNLSVDFVTGATYSWSISDISGGLSFSNTNTNTMMPTAAGVYTISVTQTINGCTSLPATRIIEVKGDCFNPDFDVTFVNVGLTGNLSTNDIPLPVRIYGQATSYQDNPSACLPIVSTDGTYSFTCGVAGRYKFYVLVCSGQSAGSCSNIPLVITVLEPFMSNNPPIANHDYVRTKVNVPIDVNMAANDKCQSLPNCTLNSPIIIIAPSNGTFNPLTSRYTPASGFIGQDSMRYRICQSPSVTPKNCEEAWVYFTVISDGAPNVTNGMDDYGQTALNTPLVKNALVGVKSNDTDPEGHTQIVTPMDVTIAGKGNFLILSDGSYIFTPYTDYSGPVDCPYEVCDNGTPVACDIATLHILVEPFNPTGNVGNFVWNDTNGNGTQDSGEQGIPGITVNLRALGGALVASTMTNASGNYNFDNVLAGTYYLQFIKPEQYSFTFAKIGNNNAIDSDVTGANGAGTTSLFTMFSGQQLTDMDAGLYICSQIGDRVWYDENKNDIWNTNENGINALRVNLWRNHFGTWTIWDFTTTSHKPGTPSDDGYYSFCVPPGQYYVQVIMPPLGLVQALPNRGNNPQIDSDLTNANGPSTTNSFNVVSGQNRLDIWAGFYPEAKAGNLVWRDENMNGIQEAGEPKVAGIVVQAYDAETHQMIAQAITDSDGAYEIDYLMKKDIYMKFGIPSGYSATYPQATADHMDSDVDHSYGPNTTRRIAMIPGVHNQNIDLGITYGLLPVDWMDVSAKSVNDAHLVSWSTAREVNVSHYIIERRIGDSGDFLEVGEWVTGKGNSNSVNFYEQKLRGIEKSGVYYYRIRQIDIDGKYSYSKIVTVLNDGDTNIRLYPVPATTESTLELTLTRESDLKVELFDASSKLIQLISKTHRADAGEHVFRLNLEDLSGGVYTIVITIEDQVLNRKLIKID
ncbi:MAG: carboxypeptidase regulatory-like domain-containing protein [Saprospiraceae bacterium]|nr:carboxypeptidase regulatory-like domain-containing protein [Saprospiraceae bacterium]